MWWCWFGFFVVVWSVKLGYEVDVVDGLVVGECDVGCGCCG